MAEAKETIQRTKSSLVAEGNAWLADIDFGPGGGYVKADVVSRYLAAARAFEEALGTDHPKTIEAKTWAAISRLNDMFFITNDELQVVENSIDLYSQRGDASVVERMFYSVSNALIPQYHDSMRWINKLSGIDQDKRRMLRWTHKSLSAHGILSRLTEDGILQSSDQTRLQSIQLDTQSMVSSTTFSFIDAAALQAHALVLYRLGEYSDALDSATTATGLRKDIEGAFPEDSQKRTQNLIEQSILAMSHFQLAQPLPESDPARVEHLAAAKEALENCQAIMTDPTALNPEGQPWADNRIAQSLLAEAEGLIEEEEGGEEE